MKIYGGDEDFTLVKSENWKLWLSGGMFAVAALGFLIPQDIGRTLGLTEVSVELGALLLAFSPLGWVFFTIRCKYCGLRLVMYAMSKLGISEWLHWLLTVKKCPNCGKPNSSQGESRQTDTG